MSMSTLVGGGLWDNMNNQSSIRFALTVATQEALPSAFVVYRLPFAAVLPKIEQLGYDGVELALLDRSQIEMMELKHLLADTRLSIPMVSTGQVFAAGKCSFASREPEVRRRAEQLFEGLIDVAAELGAFINVGRVRGCVEQNGSRSDVEARVAESLYHLSEKAEHAGISIVLEPVNRYVVDFLNSCEEAVDFLDRYGLDRIKIMPDLFHMNIEEASIEGSLMKWIDRIAYIHFADSNRHFPGDGHLDFSKIITTLRAIEYKGWIGVEILPYPDPDSAAAAAIHHLRRFA